MFGDGDVFGLRLAKPCSESLVRFERYGLLRDSPASKMRSWPGFCAFWRLPKPDFASAFDAANPG